jgi:hypothetical protein
MSGDIRVKVGVPQDELSAEAGREWTTEHQGKILRFFEQIELCQCAEAFLLNLH